MEPTDLTVRILQELRDGQKAQTAEFRELREEMRIDRERSDQRFEIIETSLRDLAEQLVMMTRAVKVALESRATNEARLDDHERRLRALEDA
ncbi:MAG: hypothetical protein QM817_37295 [Archangium sp.]